MSEPKVYFEAADVERDALRAAVRVVDEHVAYLPSARSGADAGLPAAWAGLVRLLALGAPRQLRTCPTCGHIGMRDATLCGHCWAHLAPLPASEGNRPETAGGADS
jgi:hypothetical protein